VVTGGRWGAGAVRNLLPLLALLAVPVSLAAHSGEPPLPGEIWRIWTLDPWTMGAIGTAALVYRRGTREMWRRAGPDRGIRGWEALSYLLGLLALVVALISPLDALGAALFSAHMLQHVILMLVAAPLIVLGRPGIALLWALPARPRGELASWLRFPALRAGWSFISRPAGAWVVHGAAVWIWHAPVLYMAAVDNQVVHALQHAAFFFTAVLFWWTATRLARARRRRYGIGILYVFTTALHGAALGALITFSSILWYPIYAGRTEAWGLAPLEDQQLGGLVMWVPSGVLYLLAALLLLGLGLSAGDGKGRGRRRAPEDGTIPAGAP
jgi:putative membrane protein